MKVYITTKEKRDEDHIMLHTFKYRVLGVLRCWPLGLGTGMTFVNTPPNTTFSSPSLIGLFELGEGSLASPFICEVIFCY